ncbi:MAG: ribonuclease P protein component 1 [Candidatus Aenigmatarchaeota archaeon]|nr:MAG: ribonuclease P protein component 1 [Candidatus Aenigmarchaeota archaeon]
MRTITPGNVVNHELIGLKVKVVEADNKAQKGIEGRVVDETKGSLVVETQRGEKKVDKKGRTFAFTIPSGKRVRVDGNVIAYRPEDRIKRRLEKW